MDRFFITSYSISKTNYMEKYRSPDSRYRETCIGYILKGRAEYLFDGKKYTVGEGDLIYIPKNSVCVSFWSGSPQIEFYSVCFDSVYSEKLNSLSFQRLEGVDRSAFDAMESAYGEHYARSLGTFYMLLDELLPRLVSDNPAEKSVILPAIDHIREHYTEKITVGELAMLCGISPSYLYSKFRERLGCSPIEYKNSLLAQEAARLLIDEGLSVEAVSERLSFASTTHFRHIFKKYTGKLPKCFKR